jgi:hypothetical protein
MALDNDFRDDGFVSVNTKGDVFMPFVDGAYIS